MKQPYSQRPHRGLLDRIKQAEDELEIAALMAEGGSFEDADPGTVQRWRRAAKKRREQIQKKSEP